MTQVTEPQQVWRGPFSSWQSAVDRALDSQFAWSTQSWMSRQSAFLEEATAAQFPPPRPTSLPLVAGLLNPRRIVDYGGGSGWAFALLKDSCPDLKLNAYTVFELPDVVAAIELLPSVDPRLTYLSFDDTRHMPKADLLYANAALHYAETERSFLETALALGPVPNLLLDGFLAHPEREFFLVQHVYGHNVPVRIPNLSHSLQTLREIGYRVTSCLQMLGPVSGVPRYDLPLEHFGPLYTDTKRYCITAKFGEGMDDR